MHAVTDTQQGVPTFGALCTGADWACAHGDLAALRDVSLRLAARADEPLHCALTELADVCYRKPDQAAALWTRLKQRIHRDDGR
jgi:hypothetical protein